MGGPRTTVIHGLRQVELMAPVPGGATSSVTRSMAEPRSDSAPLSTHACVSLEAPPDSALLRGILPLAGLLVRRPTLLGRAGTPAMAVSSCRDGRPLCCCRCCLWMYRRYCHAIRSRGTSSSAVSLLLSCRAIPLGQVLDSALPSCLGVARWLQEGTYPSGCVRLLLCQLREG